MAHPQVAVFARLADGNAATVRRIEGQKTLLHRPIHSIFYDEIHDEMVVPAPFAQAVLIFRGGADGEEAPIRIIQGRKTELIYTDIVAADPAHNEIFVPTEDINGQSMIYVFDRLARGDVAPIRKLGGPDARVGGGEPSIVSDHNLLLTGRGSQVRIFNRTDSGNAKPLRVITGGPKSGTTGPSEPHWLPGTRNFIAATRRFGAKTAGDVEGAPINYQTAEEAQTFVGVWSIDDNGDVAPRWTIAHNVLKEFRNFAVDPKNKAIMMTDKTANAIYTFSFPEAWEPISPVR